MKHTPEDMAAVYRRIASKLRALPNFPPLAVERCAATYDAIADSIAPKPTETKKVA